MFAFFGLGIQEMIVLAAIAVLVIAPIMVIAMIRASGGSTRREEYPDDGPPRAKG